MRRTAGPQSKSFTCIPQEYTQGIFEDARNEHGGDLVERAGVLLLRYLQAKGRIRLSVVAGLLSERYPFHKQPLSFFRKVAQKLAKEGLLALEGDFLLTPVAKVSADLQRRLVEAWRNNHA